MERGMDLTKKSFNVPLTDPQREKLTEAAVYESHRRGEQIAPTTLFRELAMARVKEILADSSLDEIELEG